MKIIDENKLIEFVTPYYADKDLMHNMNHITLVLKYVDKVISWGNYKEIDYEKLMIAGYFHGFVYSHEPKIRDWLSSQNVSENDAEFILKIANESQRSQEPETLEGKILHDAHVIEGGETYLLTKCLLTGTARGQGLMETIEFMGKYVIDKNKCYLPETIPVHEKANTFAKEYIAKLKKDLM